MSMLARLMLLATLVLGGCAPDLGPPASLVDGPRVLAVRATPAEVAPGAAVTLEALVVDVGGVRALPIDWALCTTPKPPTVDNVVATACLDGGAAPLARGVRASATIPVDACKRFGPQAAGPDLRPRDADITGGFYQPVRARVVGADAFGLVRTRCDLAQAPLRVVQAFRARYRDNIAPRIDALELPATVTPSQQVTLAVDASGAEAYLRYDSAAATLVSAGERLLVSWFATAGSFELERSDATAGRAEVRFVAPATAGRVFIFAVLRDSRGGVDFESGALDVR